MAKIDNLFMTKTAEKHTLWGPTYLYSPYKGVTPPPPPPIGLVSFGEQFHMSQTLEGK